MEDGQKTEKELIALGLRMRPTITDARTYYLDKEGNELSPPGPPSPQAEEGSGEEKKEG